MCIAPRWWHVILHDVWGYGTERCFGAVAVLGAQCLLVNSLADISYTCCCAEVVEGDQSSAVYTENFWNIVRSCFANRTFSIQRFPCMHAGSGVLFRFVMTRYFHIYMQLVRSAPVDCVLLVECVG